MNKSAWDVLKSLCTYSLQSNRRWLLYKWSEFLISWLERVRRALCPLAVIRCFTISPLTSQWMRWLLLWTLYLINCMKLSLEKQISSLAYLFLSWHNKPFFLISWFEVKWGDKFHFNVIQVPPAYNYTTLCWQLAQSKFGKDLHGAVPK